MSLNTRLFQSSLRQILQNMSWINQKAEIDENDKALLRFSVTQNEVFRIRKDEEENDDCLRIGVEVLHLRDENEWSTWIESEDLSVTSPSLTGEDNGVTEQTPRVSSSINLIMGGKTSSLAKMPFSENTFSELMRKMKIHRSIIRAINRNTTCTFSRMMPALGAETLCHRSIVYTCRTAESWENDMALSVTFFPDTLTTNAIWFGCNLEDRSVHGHRLSDSMIITSKLREFDGEVFHPMMLPAMFAEFERDRHVNLVRKSNTQFIQRMIDIESRNDVFYGIQQINRNTQQSTEKNYPPQSTSPSRTGSFFDGMKGRVGSFLSGKTLSTSSTFNSSVGSETLKSESTEEHEDEDEEETCAMLWIKISHLKNGMESWKTQLRKMLDHLQELEDTDFGMNRNIPTKVWRNRRDGLKECGKRIRERLSDLVDEYDEFIRECDHIMAGMSLATQLDLNHIGRKDARLNENISRSSLAVAETAQRDGSLMKSIAILGMIYLPATFVCTFFSMGFFQWRGQDANTTTVSPDFWVFGLSAAIFTLLTVGVFLACTMNRGTRMREKLHIV
ncbi:hypothetical protein V8C40DRAFT_247851 [Trichoderma camerunense]